MSLSPAFVSAAPAFLSDAPAFVGDPTRRNLVRGVGATAALLTLAGCRSAVNEDKATPVGASAKPKHGGTLRLVGVYVLVQLLTDIAYALLDPRVRLG